MCVLTVDSLWKFKFKQNITSHREVYRQFPHAQSIVCEEKKSKQKKLYFFFVGNASERIHPESIIAPEAAL